MFKRTLLRLIGVGLALGAITILGVSCLKFFGVGQPSECWAVIDWLWLALPVPPTVLLTWADLVAALPGLSASVALFVGVVLACGWRKGDPEDGQ